MGTPNNDRARAQRVENGDDRLNQGQLAAAIGQLYEATLDPAGWPRFMESFCTIVGARAAHFYLLDTTSGIPVYSTVSGPVQSGAEQLYAEHYIKVDPRVELLAAFSSDQWLLCHRHFDRRYVSRSEFYNDFLIPMGYRYGAHLRTAEHNGVIGYWGFFRHVGEQPFEGESVSSFQFIAEHVNRAASCLSKLKGYG